MLHRWPRSLSATGMAGMAPSGRGRPPRPGHAPPAPRMRGALRLAVLLLVGEAAPAARGNSTGGACFLRAAVDLRACRRFHGIDTFTRTNGNGNGNGSGSGTWTRHAAFNCFQGHGAACVGPCGSLGSNYTLEACEAACLREPNCTAVCVPPPPPAPPKPELPYTDVFGSATQICTGAQMIATKKSLLVWGECQIKPTKNPDDPKNLAIQLRRSTDFGGTCARLPSSRLALSHARAIVPGIIARWLALN